MAHDPKELKLSVLVDIEAVAKANMADSITQFIGGNVLEAVVDADLDRFAEFYSNVIGNGSLSGYERAAIKTYLHWKTHPEKK